MEDLIDIECSHPDDQQQVSLDRSATSGFQSVSSSSSGSPSQPQSERASPKSPDSDTPRPPSSFDQTTVGPFAAFNESTKLQLSGAQSLAETVDFY